MAKRYGYTVIPGTMTHELFNKIPEVPEGKEYPIIRGWHQHDTFQFTINMIQQVNQHFLDRFGKLPHVTFEQNANLELEGSTYATPMIRFDHVQA